MNPIEKSPKTEGKGSPNDVMLKLIRTHAITTPKPCQDRKVAAIQDACDRRGLRVVLD